MMMAGVFPASPRGSKSSRSKWNPFLEEGFSSEKLSLETSELPKNPNFRGLEMGLKTVESSRTSKGAP